MRIERSKVDVEKVTGQIFCDGCHKEPEINEYDNYKQFYTIELKESGVKKHLCKRCWYINRVVIEYPNVFDSLFAIVKEYNEKRPAEMEPWDILTHMDAAKVKNMNFEDYIWTLPRSYEEFVEYFRGTDFESLSLSFKQ